MCSHLLAAGYAVSVHTRSQAKAQPLVEAGAHWAASPADLAARSDVVCVMVGYPADVASVVDAVLPSLRTGCFLVDFTSSSPALARDIAARAAAQGCHALDAPVTGGDVGAREARLAILCGGDAAAFAALQPLLRLLGTPHLLGAAGSGQAAKLANQVAIATCMIGLCEVLRCCVRLILSSPR